MEQGDVGRQDVLFLMPADNPRVDLDADDPFDPAGQGEGQRTQSHPEFDDGVVRSWRGPIKNRLDDLLVDQEVLAEAFAGGQLVVLEDGLDVVSSRHVGCQKRWTCKRFVVC